ncbi:hypothetical protein [Streptomyces sp. Ag82_O1-15]|uniref:hypothetical protein n=1 Tax=Streptomyces sp. Ag82_O1-15 TaxID=1938855 RepID=UPI000BB16378|nr:hypothetical protein [Streptomyces sp. Ag82_O1-15]
MCGTETVGVLGGVVVELVDVRGVAAGGVVVVELVDVRGVAAGGVVVVELVDVRGVAAGGVVVGYLQGAVSVPTLTIDIGSPFFGQVNNASASERDE